MLANFDGNKFEGDNKWYFLRELCICGQSWKMLVEIDISYWILCTRTRIWNTYTYTCTHVHVLYFIQVYRAAWRSIQNGDVLLLRYRATYQQAYNLRRPYFPSVSLCKMRRHSSLSLPYAKYYNSNGCVWLLQISSRGASYICKIISWR